MNRLALLFVSLLALGSCTFFNSNREVAAVVDTIVVVENKEKPVDIGRKDFPIYDKLSGIKNKLSEIADSIEFCALAPDPLLDGTFVADVALTDSDVFVIWRIDAIYRFDRAGRFKNKIGSLGQGPEEYAQFGDNLMVDEEQRTVTVVDAGQIRIKTYDYDGKLLKSVPIPNRYATSLIKMDAGTYIVRTVDSERYRPNCPALRLMDVSGKLIKTYKSHLYPITKDKEKGWHYGPMQNSLWEYNGHFYTLEYGNDTIYRVDKNQLVADRTLSGTNYRPSMYNLFHSGSGDKRLLLPMMMRPNSDIFESDRFVLFRCFEESKRYFMVYDKTDGQVYQSLHEDAPVRERTGEKLSAYFTDDLVSGMPFTPEYRSGEKIIGWLSAPEIVENREKILQFAETCTSAEAARFREIVTRMKEDDNPVLMIVKLK